MAQIKELFDKILSIQELTINKLNDVNDKHQENLSGYYTKAEMDELLTSANITISKVDAGSYKLVDSKGNQLGETIQIVKDQVLKGASYDVNTRTITLTWYTVDNTETTTDIDLAGLVDEYTPGDGISITGGVISAIIDSTSESFLTVGANGIKLSGVEDKINDIVNSAVLSGVGDIDLTTNGIQNNSTVTGTTATDALNTLNTNISILNNFKNDAGNILSGSYLTELDDRLTTLENQLNGI